MSDFPFQIRLERAVTTLEDHARRLSELESAKPAVLANEIRQLREDLHEVRDELRQTKRGLYTVGLTVAGGLVTWALTLYQISGG